MSDLNTIWERRCGCGKRFKASEIAMLYGLGRYCSTECFEKSLEDHEGQIYLLDYKPRGATEDTRTFEVCVRFDYPKFTRYKHKHCDFSFVGNPMEKNFSSIAWVGPECLKYCRSLPSPVTYGELVKLFTEVFKNSSEAMFRAIILAKKEEFELLHLQAALI
jgi:hypothetical protein